MNNQEFREAMAHLGASVNVITTNGQAGIGGFTATAVCSVTDTPPTLLVCMNTGGFQYERFVKNGVLCVNVLQGCQEAVSNIFSGMKKKLGLEERFEHCSWFELDTGSPVLKDSLAGLDCEIYKIEEVGTHGVFFCKVKSIYFAEGKESLIYYGRKYHTISARA